MVCVFFNTAQFIDDSFTEWGYGHFLSIDENIRFDELFPDEMRSEQTDQLGSQVKGPWEHVMPGFSEVIQAVFF